ncbi:MAG: hypothetical protein RJQ09_20060 [Cyclobacteriaceae bacterium]
MKNSLENALRQLESLLDTSKWIKKESTSRITYTLDDEVNNYRVDVRYDPRTHNVIEIEVGNPMPNNLIRLSDSVVKVSPMDFINMSLMQPSVKRKYSFRGKLYQTTYTLKNNSEKVTFRRIEPFMNLKTWFDFRLTSLLEIGFVTSSSLTKEEEILPPPPTGE